MYSDNTEHHNFIKCMECQIQSFEYSTITKMYSHTCCIILTTYKSLCSNSKLLQRQHRASSRNAVSRTSILTVYNDTFFDCNNGFQSSGGTILPFYTCLTLDALIGQWSNVNYTCISTKLTILLILDLIT